MRTRTRTLLIAGLTLAGVAGVTTTALALSAEPGPATGAEEGREHARPPRLLGFHGEILTLDADGNVVTVVYDAGEVTAADEASVTVMRADGEAVTWAVDADTRHRDGALAELVGMKALVVDRDGDAVADAVLTRQA